MGHRNVDRVLLAQPPLALTPAAWRVLVLMAKVAHDDTGLYYAGHEWLQMAAGLGRGPGGGRVIRRLLRDLQAAGFVRVLDKRHGRRRVYELHLPGGPTKQVLPDHIGPI